MEKPRFTVTRLLEHIAPYPGERKEELLFHGNMSHEKVYEEYRNRVCNNIETELWIELDRGFYTLVGKIDIVDHCSKKILEVKPFKSLKNKRAILQLSAYTLMYREKNSIPEHAWIYRGYFLVYNWKEPTKFYIVKPFYLDFTILKQLDEIARRMIGNGGNNG